MEARVSAVVEPLSWNGLTVLLLMGYTADTGDTMERELVTREMLEHVLATMLQVITDAYYRAGYLTTEHHLLELQKTALEKAIIALRRETTEKSEHT
jgi:cell division protein FtsB